MTLIELREMCAKKVLGYVGLCLEDEDIIELANEISAIQIPEQAPENTTVNDSLTVAALEKQVKELKTRLNQNVSLLVNETLQSENEILLKKASELKESLRWVVDFVSPDGSYDHKELQLAKERAK